MLNHAKSPFLSIFHSSFQFVSIPCLKWPENSPCSLGPRDPARAIEESHGLWDGLSHRGGAESPPGHGEASKVGNKYGGLMMVYSHGLYDGLIWRFNMEV